jgi:hypothetical protein
LFILFFRFIIVFEEFHLAAKKSRFVLLLHEWPCVSLSSFFSFSVLTAFPFRIFSWKIKRIDSDNIPRVVVVLLSSFSELLSDCTRPKTIKVAELLGGPGNKGKKSSNDFRTNEKNLFFYYYLALTSFKPTMFLIAPMNFLLAG